MSQQETPLSILHLEDNVADALLIAYQIKADLPGCCIEHVVTAAPFLAALERGGVDLILSDYRMRDFLPS